MKEEILELLEKMDDASGWFVSVETFSNNHGIVKTISDIELFEYEGEADLIQKMKQFIAEREEI